MEIRISIIGPGDLVQTAVEVGQGFTGISFVPMIYQREEEVFSLLGKFKERKGNQDLVIFTEHIPFHLVREKLEVDFPIFYIPNSSEELISCLFKAAWRDGRNVEQASIDCLKAKIVQEGYEQLGLSAAKVKVENRQGHPTAGELMEFHRSCYEKGEADVLITGLRSTYNQLKELGLPAYRLIPTKSSIRETFSLAILEAKTLQNKDSQAAIGILCVDNCGEQAGAGKTEYDFQRMKLRLQQIILEYAESIQASVTYMGGDEFIIFATGGALEETINCYEITPLIAHIQNELSISVSIGLGLGNTAAQAEKNARIALANAKKQGYSSCFLVTEEGEVTGPLGTYEQLVSLQRMDFKREQNIANAAGLSITTIRKLEALVNNLGRTTITANELAHGFGVTLRSGRRVLYSLEQANLAQKVGQEQPLGRGRPRQLYKICLG